jgi:type II secretory pathway pseudopilin PulG
MVVVAIISILILGLVGVFSGGVRSWISANYQLKAQREARQVLDYMVKEIRSASHIKDSISDANTIGVSIPDFDENNPSHYIVSYSVGGDNNQLKRVKSGSASILIENVKKLEFLYFDSNGIEVNPLDEEFVSKINIEFEIDADKDGKPDINLKTEVRLRNFS